MPATIETLDKTLQDILTAIKGGANKGGGREDGMGNKGAPKTLGDAFSSAFQKGQKGGFGVQSGLMDKAGQLGNISGRGAAVAGPIGAIAAPIIAVGIELAKVPEKVRAFANELHTANRAFAEFSPKMAAVFAQADIGDFMRKMKQGDTLAESAGNLASGRGHLEDALAPIDTQLQAFKNEAGALLSDAVATALDESGFNEQLAEILRESAEVLKDIREWLGVSRKQTQISDEDIDRMIIEEENKIADRRMPVAPAAPKPLGEPRPDFPWDRGGGGDF